MSKTPADWADEMARSEGPMSMARHHMIMCMFRAAMVQAFEMGKDSVGEQDGYLVYGENPYVEKP